MDRELTKEQTLAIRALKKAVKRANESGLVICMQDGSVVIHYADQFSADRFDHGCYGLEDESGETVDAIDSFSGIEH
tara:strand:- start:155 stop:385 length:231 start_codon:yes stop_codon:yes gene_type:complete